MEHIRIYIWININIVLYKFLIAKYLTNIEKDVIIYLLKQCTLARNCVICLLVCVPVIHILFYFLNKKQESTCNTFLHWLCNDFFSLHFFCFLLILIEDCCFYLFPLKAFQSILE